MFGYVKTYTPELKVSEYECYRAAYCGLCRSMGKCTGQCSRMTLSYDFAFLAIMRMSIAKSNIEFQNKRCIAHPLHKRKMIKQNPELDFCSYAAALLTYHKLADDISDEKGSKKALALITKPFVKKMRKRSLRKGNLSGLDSIISQSLASLSEFEHSGETSVDIPADIFGSMLAEIMCFGFDGNDARIARNIGYHIGKWIYITDALDDFSEDVKKSRYNPLILMYGKDMSDSDRNTVALALKNELCDIECALDLIDFTDDTTLKNIIYNVFYLGMPRTVKAVSEGEEKDNKKSKHKRGDNP